ncbi:uncharacterized protein LOC128388519 isoform X2 [Panonychus citri]|uniref:uncharacterized protein LOC128388519 isoform X2 n=1 Tax=Panonychus citri TaxID=50023 RepID=UPI0023077C95|nr:uncharacterized protein LOC128388519 isoform X2 [Panonychus citri]
MKSYQQLIVIITFILTWEHVNSAPQIKLQPYSANQTGCTYDGRVYYDGQRIPHSPNPCVTCYCKRNIVRCALNECRFRYDCEPEYVPGQCCPKYDHCNRNNQKNKFRATNLQENMEPGNLIKSIVDSKSGSKDDDISIESVTGTNGGIGKTINDQDTTEIVTIMRNDHQSKSSLINESTNRINLRRKKVYIGPNNRLLINPIQPTIPSISSTSKLDQLATTTVTDPTLISGMVSLSSGLISEQLTTSTVEPNLMKDFVDEVKSETRKPPYELDFHDLHQSTTSLPQSELINSDPLVEIDTTENGQQTATITTLRTSINYVTRSPKSLLSPSTNPSIVGDEIETESIPVDLQSTREESETNLQNLNDYHKKGLINQPTLVNLKSTNKTLGSSSYVRNIYKTTVSFFNGLIGRFG